MLHAAVRDSALAASLHRGEATRALEPALRGERARHGRRRPRLVEQRLHARSRELQARDVAEASPEADVEVPGEGAARHPSADRRERHLLLRQRDRGLELPQEQEIREVDEREPGVALPLRLGPHDLDGAAEGKVLDAQEPRPRVIGHDHRGVLHGELPEDDPQGRAGGHGRSFSAGREPLVVEGPARVHDEGEAGALERQPLHLHSPGEQGKEAVAQDERVRGEKLPRERGWVRHRDAPQGHAGDEREAHLPGADLGPGGGGRLGEKGLLEGGCVQLPDEVPAVARGHQEHREEQGQRTPQGLAHVLPHFGHCTGVTPVTRR